MGPVALLLRILERIQRGEGRGKGRRFASPWVNVARLERIPQPVTVRRSDLPGAAAWKISAARIRSAWAWWPRCRASWRGSSAGREEAKAAASLRPWPTWPVW